MRNGGRRERESEINFDGYGCTERYLRGDDGLGTKKEEDSGREGCNAEVDRVRERCKRSEDTGVIEPGARRLWPMLTRQDVGGQ